MNREAGDKEFPIWLVGDSNPKNWSDILVTPLDPRHPARHSIWTPVLEIIQDRVFRENRRRVDTSSLYIRNAIELHTDKPADHALEWSPHVQFQVEELRLLLERYRPRLLLSFGAFAFEFARRALVEGQKQPYGQWGAETLSDQFRQRIERFDPMEINVLPLLHTSISRGRFIESHNYFSGKKGGNYFEYAGNSIADKFLEYSSKLEIWID